MTKIAIVGMGCRFAGAPDLHSFWKMSVEGRHSFTAPPADRWDHDAFHSTSRRATDKSYAPTGAFIEDVRTFPALALGIPPRRVEVMDPQQRFAIEVALQTIEDSGYNPKQLPRRTGVYMGVTASEFRSLMGLRLSAQLMASGDYGLAPEDVEALSDAVSRVVPSRPFSAPGGLSNMIAAAVAQELDLHGPAYTVDAACASALMAVYNGVAQLRSGAIDAAIAGGVYVCLTPLHHIAFSRIGAMSPTGVCRPFDQGADGFVQGDGAATIMLKRLEDAQRDGDRIYAIIDGIAINNDGRGDGPMAPVMDGQADVINLAWNDSGLSPESLGYVETHGTGTSVGDVTEFRGLQSSIGGQVKEAYLGSSKANVGHTMSAAGVTGIIRAALSCYHGVIPPMANFEQAKPDLQLKDSGFAISNSAQQWTKDIRVAGVSSFGFGGTNGHVVLSNVRTPTQHADRPELVLLSAPDETKLRGLAARTATAIETDLRVTVAGVAKAWAHRRPERARLGIVAHSRDDLISKLRAIGAGENCKDAFIGERTVEPKIAYLYPGQGSQRPGMLRDIRDRFDTVASSLNQMSEALKGSLSHPLNELIYPETRAKVPSEEQGREELRATQNCQPALLACGIALTELLRDFGINPSVVVGHSLGEFTAAAVGGVIRPDEAARFVAKRGKAMSDLSGEKGTMAAIMADADTVRELLVDGAVIANINHPRQVVISGAKAAVMEVVQRAELADLKAVPLEVSHGFHSPVLHKLNVDALVDELELIDPTITVASGIAAKPYANASEAREVFRQHAISPVIFTRALEQCREDGANLYLQVGAGGPLASFARGALPKDHLGILTLASMDDQDQGSSLLKTLAKLWVRGVNVDLKKTVYQAEIASVPPSILPREDYWCVKGQAQMKLRLEAGTGRPIEVAEVAEEAPAPINVEDPVLDRLLDVVSKVSAYPKNSLQTGMSLTNDLGFDSLMVGDLATGIAEAFPGLGGIPQELFINNPSVQDLADYINTGGDGSQVSEAADNDPLNSYALGWSKADFPSWDLNTPLKHCSGKRVLVAGEEHDLSAAIREALRSNGASVVDSANEAVDAVIWLAHWQPPASPQTDPAPEDQCGRFIQTLAAQVSNKPRVLVVRREDDHWSGGLGSAARCLAREWEGSIGKEVLVQTALTAEGVAPRVIAELYSNDQSGCVRHCYEGRYVRSLTAIESQERFQATEHDTVLITGGTKGIGLQIARRMAPSGAGLLLVGRSQPSDDAASFIAEHPRVRFVQADVTDAEALHGGIRSGLAADESISVLIHSAGVLADGPLDTVAAEIGEAAHKVKVDGWLNALRCCGDSLKVALGLGSWAGRFGNRHQAHYAAANGQMASLAAAGWGKTRCVVSEFGPWSSSDMVSTIPAPVKAAMRAEGVDFVGDEVGVDAVLDALGSEQGVTVQGRRVPAVLRRLVRTETISTETHPYLLDHAIEGTPIFPLAAAANNIAFTSCIPAPFELSNLTLYQGVAVNEPMTLTTIVDNGRGEIRFGAKGSLAYKGTIRKWESEYEDPGSVKAGRSPQLSLENFYEDITFHGPLLQGITSIDGETDESIRGHLRRGSPSDWMTESSRKEWSLITPLEWTIDPLVLDSVMQLSGYIAFTRYQRAGTPVGIDRYIQLQPLRSDVVVGEVRVGPSGGDRFSADLYLRDENGGLLAVAEGAAAEMRQVTETEEPFEIDPAWVNPSEWSEVKDLKMRIEAVGLMGLRNPYFAVHDGTARDVTSIEGREHINFSSYNYIGLSGDHRVIEDVHTAVEQYGTSVSASRVASGERPFHGELETLLAECQGCEASLVFTAGHATNVTTVGHLFGPDDLIIHDELAHDSLLQGIKLSGAARRGFRHDEPEHLEQQLAELRRHYKRVLIVIEGVYSMDGDISALPQYIALKKKYGALLMVDEAHSFGVIGATGKGASEHYGIEGSQVDLWMGTLSKSLASCGGWISGSKDLITYLRYTAPGFVYSAGITPANAQAALSALKLMLQEPERVEKLQDNARFFHSCLTERGLDTGPAKGGSGVIPVVTGNSMHALVLSQRLGDAGINVQPIMFPAVADDAARLRFFLSSTHSHDQLAWTAEQVDLTLAKVREEFKL